MTNISGSAKGSAITSAVGTVSVSTDNAPKPAAPATAKTIDGETQKEKS